MPAFEDKQDAREWAWETLDERGLARFPFPPHGRIPNFEGAPQAAQRALEHAILREADRVKVNPDAPQRFLREALLARGTTVLVPTPRLKGGFKRLDPSRIPAEAYGEAAALSSMDEHATPVALDALEPVDAIVAGSVAVDARGHRVGKGEGYSDLEYAILRELGHPPAPVVTTVHELQLVDGVPRSPTDAPLVAIVTPERTVDVDEPPTAPEGIVWDKLGEDRIAEMPVLERLRAADEGSVQRSS